jgi:predicted nuclease of restriction endonuclease-like (RecB) superfamily
VVVDGDGAGGADAVAPHGEELEEGAVVAGGAEAGLFCFVGEPGGDFEFVEGAGFAAAEVVAGHGEDVGFDVGGADGGEGGLGGCVYYGDCENDCGDDVLVLHGINIGYGGDKLNANLFGIILINLVYLISFKSYFMARVFSVDSGYREWIVDLKSRIRSSQIKAALNVNRQLLEMYWELGKEICEKQKKANWGEGLIEQVSKDLAAEFPGMKGFSQRNLLYIKRWYFFYVESRIVQQAAAGMSALFKIPWWHHVVIMSKCLEVEEALFYVHRTIHNNSSRAVLVRRYRRRRRIWPGRP